MLILTRREGEAIQIFPSKGLSPATTIGELFADGPIRVMVAETGTQVKFGVSAPQGLVVLREELVSG